MSTEKWLSSSARKERDDLQKQIQLGWRFQRATAEGRKSLRWWEEWQSTWGESVDFLENSVSERKEEVKRRRREREDLHRSRAARPIKAYNADVAKLVSSSQSSIYLSIWTNSALLSRLGSMSVTWKTRGAKKKNTGRNTLCGFGALYAFFLMTSVWDDFWQIFSLPPNLFVVSETNPFRDGRVVKVVLFFWKRRSRIMPCIFVSFVLLAVASQRVKYRKRRSASYIVREWLLWRLWRQSISRWNREWSCIWLLQRRVDPTRRRVLTLSPSGARVHVQKWSLALERWSKRVEWDGWMTMGNWKLCVRWSAYRGSPSSIALACFKQED